MFNLFLLNDLIARGAYRSSLSSMLDMSALRERARKSRMNCRTSLEAVVSISWQASMKASRNPASIRTTSFTSSSLSDFFFFLPIAYGVYTLAIHSMYFVRVSLFVK